MRVTLQHPTKYCGTHHQADLTSTISSCHQHIASMEHLTKSIHKTNGVSDHRNVREYILVQPNSNTAIPRWRRYCVMAKFHPSAFGCPCGHCIALTLSCYTPSCELALLIQGWKKWVSHELSQMKRRQKRNQHENEKLL